MCNIRGKKNAVLGHSFNVRREEKEKEDKRMLCKNLFRMNKHSLICDHTAFLSLISNVLTLLIDRQLCYSVFKHFRLKGQCCASMLPEYQY